MKPRIILLALFFIICVTGISQNPNPNVREIIIVTKMHFDIGYTDFAREVVKSYNTVMIPKALDTYEKNKSLPEEERFVWTLSGWPMTQIINHALDAKQKSDIEEAFRNQRLVIHALPFTVETEAMETEDLVRGMHFSSELSRKYGLPLPTDGKMTDVPVHTWGLVTILHNAGIRFMHIGCNGGSPYPSVPPLYWWEGPDGSRVLTMYNKDYGSTLLPPADWPYKTYMALVMTGDNQGPPSPEEVKKMLDELHSKMPGVKVKIGRMSDFYEAIMKENPKNIPVVKKDMSDPWIYGFMTTPVETKVERHYRRNIFSAEALNTQLKLWNIPAGDISPDIQKAYEEACLYGEHTFGMDMKKYVGRQPFGEEFTDRKMKGELRKVEESWEEKAEYTYTLQKIVQDKLDEQMQLLAANVKQNGSRIVVYNPLPWQRSGIVNIKVKDAGNAGSLKDAENSQEIPVSVQGESIRFEARDVPAMGYKTYLITDHIVSSAPGFVIDKARNVIENRFFRITLSPDKASVVSIIDKKNNKELVDTSSKYGLGQYCWEQFSNEDAVAFTHSYTRYNEWKKTWDDMKYADWINYDFTKYPIPDSIKHKHIVASHAYIEYTEDHQSVTATIKCLPGNGMPHRTNLKITCYENQPCIDLTWSIENKAEDNLPEAGWLALPLNTDKPEYHFSRTGSIVNPATDFVDSTIYDFYCLLNGFAVTSTDQSGTGVYPFDANIISLNRTGLYKIPAKKFNFENKDVFLNLYNNVWGVNFRMWMGGSWSSGVRIWSFDKYSNESSLMTPSEEAKLPLIAAYASGNGGTLPAASAGLTLSRKGILIKAFGKNPDGEGTLLRLWEVAGSDGKCVITLPAGSNFTTASLRDLRGQLTGESIPVKNSVITVNINHFAPVSLVLK